MPSILMRGGEDGAANIGQPLPSTKPMLLYPERVLFICPTLKDKIEGTELPADVNGVFEVVINGVSEDAVKEAMRAGIKAAVNVPGVKKITAGNYGGKLGKHHIPLLEVV
jgi:formylmethanofuran--tetrahydromethanopterin N-formyltransferase